MKTETERLRELVAISRAITGVEDYQSVLGLVAEQARAFTDSRACVLLLVEPGGSAKVVASAGIAAEKVRDFRAPLDEQLSGALRQQLLVPPEDEIIAVPMILRGALRGVLAVFRGRAAERAGGNDEYLLSALADQAAIAIGHAVHLTELEAAIATAERERRAREEALETLSIERRWLRAVIEHSPVAILLVEGRTGSRATANPRAEALFGRRVVREEGVAQYASAICAPDGTPLPFDEIPSLAAAGGESLVRELAIRRPDGTLVPVLSHAAPIRDERGRSIGSVAVYEDISMLKDLERMREEWTSVIAHDLRQPLGTIAMRAQVMAKQNADFGAQLAHGTSQIVASANRLNRMVNDLLDMSLIEARHLSLERRPCRVRPFLDEIVERCADAVAGHRVELVAEKELPPVDVDPGRIEQVVANLLSNAAKYGAPETPIEIRAEVRDGAVEITVRNEGSGIAPELLPTLFQRFRRGQAAGAKAKGVGLGLYICKGIVEAHGGRMWAESSVGATTEFHFTLPMASRPSTTQSSERRL